MAKARTDHLDATGKLALPVLLRSPDSTLKASLRVAHPRSHQPRVMHVYLALTTALCTPCLCAEEAIHHNLIENGSFESTGFDGWARTCLGDRQGKMSLVKEGVDDQTAARIESPTDRSWTFLRQQGFKVALGERLSVSARVKSSSSRAKLVLTCGYLWADDPSGHTTRRAFHSGSGKWELLRTTITVRELPVSAAVGFDYRSEGQTLLVDDVRLERESDVLCQEALVLADRYDSLSRRSDVSQTLRRAAAKRAQMGRNLAGEHREKWRSAETITNDMDAWQEYHSRLRTYVDAGTQLVVRCEQGRVEDGLSVNQIGLKVRPGQDAKTTLIFLNLFGEHSVAVRVTCGRLVEKKGNGSIGSGRIRLEQVISGVERKGSSVLLSLGGASLVLVPRNEVCRIQCTIDTAGLGAGLYEGTLTALPQDRRQAGAPQKMSMRLALLPPET